MKWSWWWISNCDAITLFLTILCTTVYCNHINGLIKNNGLLHRTDDLAFKDILEHHPFKPVSVAHHDTSTSSSLSDRNLYFSRIAVCLNQTWNQMMFSTVIVHILHYAFTEWWAMRIYENLPSWSTALPCFSPSTCFLVPDSGAQSDTQLLTLLMNYGQAVWPCVATWPHMLANTHIPSLQHWRRWKNMANQNDLRWAWLNT